MDRLGNVKLSLRSTLRGVVFSSYRSGYNMVNKFARKITELRCIGRCTLLTLPQPLPITDVRHAHLLPSLPLATTKSRHMTHLLHCIDQTNPCEVFIGASNTDSLDTRCLQRNDKYLIILATFLIM